MLRDHWDRYTPILTPIGIDLMPMLTNDIFSGTHANPMRCIFGARCPILLRLYCNTGKTNENEIYWLLMRRRAKRVACNLPNFFPLHLGIMFFFLWCVKFLCTSPPLSSSLHLSLIFPHLSPSPYIFCDCFPPFLFPSAKLMNCFQKRSHTLEFYEDSFGVGHTWDSLGSSSFSVCFSHQALKPNAGSFRIWLNIKRPPTFFQDFKKDSS